MEIIELLYQELTQEQKSYFNALRRIGPYAFPQSLGRVKSDDEEALDLRDFFVEDNLYPFPDRVEIEKEIKEIWGLDSVPIKYFYEIFDPPEQIPLSNSLFKLRPYWPPLSNKFLSSQTYVFKNKPLSSPQTIWSFFI